MRSARSCAQSKSPKFFETTAASTNECRRDTNELRELEVEESMKAIKDSVEQCVVQDRLKVGKALRQFSGQVGAIVLFYLPLGQDSDGSQSFQGTLIPPSSRWCKCTAAGCSRSCIGAATMNHSVQR